MKKKIGVVVGRFQLDTLHEGHLSLLDRVKAESDQLVVVLGCTTIKGSKENPLDFETRFHMIQEYDDTIEVWKHMDNKSDEQWSKNLDVLLKSKYSYSDDIEITLHHSRDSFRSHYSGILPCKEWDVVTDICATEVRKRLGEYPHYFNDDPARSFRAGIIYASQQNYDKVSATVDCFVYNHSDDTIMLGRRKDTTEWRLCGGYSSPEDESFRHSAQRELEEESGLKVSLGNFEYIESFRVDDWRHKRTADKIITTLFWVDVVGNPTVKGADDIEEVKWFPRKQVFGIACERLEIAKEHLPLVCAAHIHYLSSPELSEDEINIRNI